MLRSLWDNSDPVEKGVIVLCALFAVYLFAHVFAWALLQIS